MSKLTKESWGTTQDGEAVDLFTFRTANGLEAAITNYGGRLVRLKTPDRRGRTEDLVLGFDTLDGYLKRNPFFGALVGRYANRIANAEFTLDGHAYHISRNSGENSIHGGFRGFDKVVWRATEVQAEQEPALELTYVSKDGEEGYPGTLTVTATYSLSEENELQIRYSAVTDKKTVVNLTNHSYFDLSGQAEGSILDHVVTINADSFTPVNSHLIPTGEVRRIDSTPFDLRKPTRIGDRIALPNSQINDEQIQLADGYDHNFVLNRDGAGPSLAARVTDPGSGRVIEVFTTQPGMQFYTGNHLDGSVTGKGGVVYGFRSGVCFETQHFPDSPHHPEFPSTELNPGERYKQSTIFRFAVE